MATEKAMFAAGCFWGIEAAFRQVEGVVEVTSGYSGGHTERPTYRAVCSDRTGHAEVVQVEFDPTKVYRQGPDVGTQYRSAIFYLTPEQETAAKASREQAQDGLSRPIATEITQATTFWPAEEYHQRYFEKPAFVGCNIPESR